MIEVRGVTVRYRLDENNVVTALEGLDLRIEAGEYLAVLGPNGSGKSTFAKLLNALIVPKTGSVCVERSLTSDAGSVRGIRRIVQMVFQNPEAQLVTTITEDEIAFGPENLALDREEINSRVEKAIDLFSLQDLRTAEPHLLSGGQKQKVAIAAAYAMYPQYLVLDEPTSMLDERGRTEVSEAIGTLRADRGVGVIHITHDIEEIVGADRVMVLSEGKQVMLVTPPELLTRLQELQDLGLHVPPHLKLYSRCMSFPGQTFITSMQDVSRALA